MPILIVKLMTRSRYQGPGHMHSLYKSGQCKDLGPHGSSQKKKKANGKKKR
jgi:hypothetical protein